MAECNAEACTNCMPLPRLNLPKTLLYNSIAYTYIGNTLQKRPEWLSYCKSWLRYNEKKDLQHTCRETRKLHAEIW